MFFIRRQKVQGTPPVMTLVELWHANYFNFFKKREIEEIYNITK
jgi:hypothetical protein